MTVQDRRLLHRLGPGDDPFGTGPLDGHHRVALQLMHADGALYLDGNQYSGDVHTVRDRTFPGVGWTFEPKPNGSWRIRNQGALSHGLTAQGGQQGGHLRLGALHPDVGHEDPMADWMIYYSGSEDGLLLRPCGAVWMVAGEGNTVRLARDPRETPAHGLWRALPL